MKPSEARTRWDALLKQVILMARESVEGDAWTGIGGITLELELLSTRFRLYRQPLVIQCETVDGTDARVCIVWAMPPPSGEVNAPIPCAAVNPEIFIDRRATDNEVNRFTMNLDRWLIESPPTRLRSLPINPGGDWLEVAKCTLDIDALWAASRLNNRRLELGGAAKPIDFASLNDNQRIIIAKLSNREMKRGELTGACGFDCRRALDSLRLLGIVISRGRGRGRGGYYLAPEFEYLAEQAIEFIGGAD